MWTLRNLHVRRWALTPWRSCGAMSLHASAAIRTAPGGYVLEKDAEVASTEPGTHNGGGQTIGYSFFKTPLGCRWYSASGR